MDLVLNHYGPALGKPLILLHGFPMDSRIWSGVVQRTPGRVITVDLFGFGKSVSAGPFTFESVARELRERLAEADALPCVLTGLSMGGYLALAFAAAFAMDLAGLILIDTKSTADDEQGKRVRDQMIQLVREQGTAAIAAQMMPRMFADPVDPVVVADLRLMMLDCPPLAIEHALTAMRDRPDCTDVLANLKCPRLILVGDQDRITPPAIAMAMQQQSPGAELIVFCGAGHMTPIEQPHQLAHAIDFFRDRRIPKS